MIGAVPVFILWFYVAFYTSPIAHMEQAVDRLLFSLQCSGLAAFFCLMMGVEAVAHDRLFSPAIDPLAGFESKRFLTNKQYLQNTLEQFVLFNAAILSFTGLSQNGEDLRIVIATTLAWILSRLIFWVAYHKSSLDRIYGLSGMMMTMLILGYSTFIFIRNQLGLPVALIFIFLFFVFETILAYFSWKKSRIQ